MFYTMVARTAKELDERKKFESNPDLVEDFYGFCFRFIRYRPDILFDSDCLEIILGNVIVGIGITQVEAGKQLYNFILELFRRSKPSKANSEKTSDFDMEILNQKAERLRKLLRENYGKVYVKNMMESLPKDTPVTPIIEEMKQAFFGILRHYPEESVEWFYYGLQEIPLSILNQAEKESFLYNVKDNPIVNDLDYYEGFFGKYVSRSYKYNIRVVQD